MKTSSNKNNSAYTVMPNNIATSSETCSSPLYWLSMDQYSQLMQLLNNNSLSLINHYVKKNSSTRTLIVDNGVYDHMVGS